MNGTATPLSRAVASTGADGAGIRGEQDAVNGRTARALTTNTTDDVSSVGLPLWVDTRRATARPRHPRDASPGSFITRLPRWLGGVPGPASSRGSEGAPAYG